MELYIIIFRDKSLGCFTQPQFTDVQPEKASLQLKRSLINAAKDGKAQDYLKYKTLDMYEMGTFDDETGEVNMKKPCLLLTCSDAIDAGLEVAEKLKGQVGQNVGNSNGQAKA